MMIAAALRAALEGREFYDLMQAYRHAPVLGQAAVSERFEAVLSYVVGFVASRETALAHCPECHAPAHDGPCTYSSTNAAQQALGAELQRLLEQGRHRAGVLLVARAPVPGVDATGRILSAVCVPDLNVETAVDLIHLIRRLRTLAVELENMMRARP